MAAFSFTAVRTFFTYGPAHSAIFVTLTIA